MKYFYAFLSLANAWCSGSFAYQGDVTMAIFGVLLALVFAFSAYKAVKDE